MGGVVYLKLWGGPFKRAATFIRLDPLKGAEDITLKPAMSGDSANSFLPEPDDLFGSTSCIRRQTDKRSVSFFEWLPYNMSMI